MFPGPPPVITANPAFAAPSPKATAAAYIGSSEVARAEPNTVIAGGIADKASNPSTNSERIRSERHESSAGGPPVTRCRRNKSSVRLETAEVVIRPRRRRLAVLGPLLGGGFMGSATGGDR